MPIDDIEKMIGTPLLEHVTDMEMEVNEVVNKLRQREHTVEALAAIVHALSNRELAVKQLGAASLIKSALVALENTVDDANERFAKATNDSTETLARWTKVMAWTTIALAVFALAQVVVAVVALFRTP